LEERPHATLWKSVVFALEGDAAAAAPAGGVADAPLAAAPPLLALSAETFLVDSRYEAAPLLVVAGCAGSSLFASGLLCSSESVVCFVAGVAPLVWCRSVLG